MFSIPIIAAFFATFIASIAWFAMRRRLLAVLLFALSYPVAYTCMLNSTGQAFENWFKFTLSPQYEYVLDVRLIKGVGIYYLLQTEDETSEPIFLKIPWDKDEAKRLEQEDEDARAEGRRVRRKMGYSRIRGWWQEKLPFGYEIVGTEMWESTAPEKVVPENNAQTLDGNNRDLTLPR